MLLQIKFWQFEWKQINLFLFGKGSRQNYTNPKHFAIGRVINAKSARITRIGKNV